MQALHKRKPRTALAVLVAVTASLLALPAASALAVGTTYTKSTGSFQAVSHLNPPPQMCATYSDYNAQLVYQDNPSAPVTASVSSQANPSSAKFQWGEFADGTHSPQTSVTGSTSCGGAPGAEEGGFSGTLATSGGGVCNLGDGSYARGSASFSGPFSELDVQFVFSSPGVGCPAGPVTLKATINYVDDGMGGYVSACNSLIAPQSCEFKNADF